jgi:hypothetical protein
MAIPPSELQDVFPRFAAPLMNGEAAARFGEPAAKQLAQTFWQAMMDGPVEEARLWRSFGESFTADDVAMLRHCYEQQMKASFSPEQLTAIGEWYLKGENEEFSIGDQVRVQYGTVDPNYPDLPVGGWAGTIVAIDEDLVCEILLNPATLNQIHPIYRKRCQRDDLRIEILDMDQEDLEPDFGEGLPIEKPTDIQTKPLDLSDYQDRIRAALGLTTDDAVPVVEQATLHTYGEYLQAHFAFPFPATFAGNADHLRAGRTISAIGLANPTYVEPEYGLICKVSDDQQVWEMPLGLLEISTNDPNLQLLEDYRHWFRLWGDSAPGLCTNRHIKRQGSEQAEPAETWRTGRNDPCPCGSGKKFKRCCLRIQTGESIFGD